jgi:hypothetical protein
MFTSTGIRILSIIALTVSLLGLGISIFGSVEATGYRFSFFMAIFSWVFLLWGSFIGFQLSSYTLHKEEYTKVGIRLLLIIAAFMLFFYVGIVAGLIISVILVSTLWGLKRNYDDWEQKKSNKSLASEETDIP